MIKNLTNLGKTHLLNFYNKIWNNDLFPQSFGHAILIPIGKPGKELIYSENFRPIALTNCLCKLMERIINKRLVWELETNKMLGNYQSGFRKNRSTADNLAFLESHIMEAFSENKFFVSIFFDLSKAYDRIWRRLIISELLSLGFKGNLIFFIDNFLKNRTFEVMLGNKRSNIKNMENGIQQGSVLSCSLFLIALDSIFKTAKSPIKIIVFADDIVALLPIKT